MTEEKELKYYTQEDTGVHSICTFSTERNLHINNSVTFKDDVHVINKNCNDTQSIDIGELIKFLESLKLKGITNITSIDEQQYDPDDVYHIYDFSTSRVQPSTQEEIEIHRQNISDFNKSQELEALKQFDVLYKQSLGLNPKDRIEKLKDALNINYFHIII